jgi:arsenite methyltransferase
MSTLSSDDIKQTVRDRYAEIARTDSGCGCSPSCCSPGETSTTASVQLGYRESDLAQLPEGADMGLGCGTPLAFAALQPGETVVDLGSGGGIDCFLAATDVGPTGRVIGVDMTTAMVDKARSNAQRINIGNVEFRLGEIERLPLADRSADVIVSNCVINLSPDKPAVFREAFRVLKPGGRVAISDIVASAPLPEAIRNDRAALASCLGGAPSIDELRASLSSAGFEGINIEINESSRAFIKGWSPESGAEQFVAAAAIRATKPAGEGCCGSAPAASSCC